MTFTIAYPFGYGLSYTAFSYRNLRVVDTDEGFDVSCTVRNDGDRTGTWLTSDEVDPHGWPQAFADVAERGAPVSGSRASAPRRAAGSRRAGGRRH